MSFVKDNGGSIGLAVLAAAVIAGYIELRLPSDADLKVRVDNAFTDAVSLASPADVAANTESIADLEVADQRMDGKIERIVDILLED